MEKKEVKDVCSQVWEDLGTMLRQPLMPHKLNLLFSDPLS